MQFREVTYELISYNKLIMIIIRLIIISYISGPAEALQGWYRTKNELTMGDLGAYRLFFLGKFGNYFL